MDKKIKFIYYSYLSLIGLLLLALIAGAGWWIIGGLAAASHQKKMASIIPLVKEAAKPLASDVLRGCVYDKDFTIVSLNHQDYFVVKGNQVKVFDLMNAETKEKYPNILVEREFMDIYWVLENCR